MIIRKSTTEDINRIMEIYEIGRQTMRNSGNMKQWVNGHPSRELIEEDIEEGIGYVLEENGKVCGVFAFFIGEDPTYRVIRDGAWLNDEPYGVIHRIASDGTCRGIVKEARDFAACQISNIRIDTHEDNKIMQHVLEKNGFIRCGMITIQDGTPRVAFQIAL